MKSFIAIAALAIVAVANAQIGGGGLGGGIGGGLGGHGHHDYYAHPHYKYSYGVSDKHTGDVKSANEVRDGHVTKGSYSLIQPDGVLRTVHYVVDGKSGFQAQVINKGVAGHPAVHHHGHHGHGHHGGIGIGGGIGGGFLG